MSRATMPFQAIQQRVCERILEYLRSRSAGCATIQEVRWFCRAASMGGMADAAIDWLEQAKAIRYEREMGAIYLAKPGDAAAVPPSPPDGGLNG